MSKCIVGELNATGSALSAHDPTHDGAADLGVYGGRAAAAGDRRRLQVGSGQLQQEPAHCRHLGGYRGAPSAHLAIGR